MPVVKNARLRMHIIDQCLRNPYRPYPDLDELRRACEEKLYGTASEGAISRSTIEKDIREMKEEYDAPIVFDRAGKGYCYTDSAYSLESISLSAEDAEALRFAVLTLDQFKNLSIFRQFHSAINKIFDRIYISDDIADASISQYVQFETIPRVLGSEWLNPLFSAIKNRVESEVLYESYNSGETRTYRLRPYLLKEYRNRWYLIAGRADKPGFYTFELGRIRQLDTTTRVFERAQDFDADAFFRHAFGITVVQGKPESVVLRFSNDEKKYLLPHPLHVSQQVIAENADNFTVQIDVYITEELVMTLLGYGEKVRVMSPDSLALQLRERHRLASLES